MAAIGFNTGGKPRTLVGNWQEERVLHVSWFLSKPVELVLFFSTLLERFIIRPTGQRPQQYVYMKHLLFTDLEFVGNCLSVVRDAGIWRR